MKKVIIFVIVFIQSFVLLHAQTPLMEEMRDTIEGQGTVVVIQDAVLDSIINGDILVPSEEEVSKPTATTGKKTDAKVNTTPMSYTRSTKTTQGKQIATTHGGTVVTKTVTTTKPSAATATPQQRVVHRTGRKVNGFRVQVYFGGSTRADEAKAREIGRRVEGRFPTHRAYLDFSPPHYVCRMGDFKSRAQADAFKSQLRNTGLAPNAMVVRSEVYE